MKFKVGMKVMVPSKKELLEQGWEDTPTGMFSHQIPRVRDYSVFRKQCCGTLQKVLHIRQGAIMIDGYWIYEEHFHLLGGRNDLYRFKEKANASG